MICKSKRQTSSDTKFQIRNIILYRKSGRIWKSQLKQLLLCITDEQRNSLIKMVIEDGLPIKDASKKCSIKLSTAKAILKVFKTQGRVGKKQCRQRKVRTKSKIGNGRIDLMMEIRKKLPKIGFNQYLCFATQQWFTKTVKEEQE